MKDKSKVLKTYGNIVSVSAMLVYIHQKKISLKFLFLSDIFLFPFIWQQFPVLT